MTLGEKIKKARIESGLTQEQLAGKMMVSRQARAFPMFQTLNY